MEWKFKILKLSTYNSLNNQLVLKDKIIKQKEMYNESLKSDIKRLNNIEIKSMNMITELRIENNKLTEDIITLKLKHDNQYKSIESLSKTVFEQLTELSKYQLARNSKGRFIKKVQ